MVFPSEVVKIKQRVLRINPDHLGFFVLCCGNGKIKKKKVNLYAARHCTKTSTCSGPAHAATPWDDRKNKNIVVFQGSFLFVLCKKVSLSLPSCDSYDRSCTCIKNGCISPRNKILAGRFCPHFCFPDTIRPNPDAFQQRHDKKAS